MIKMIDDNLFFEENFLNGTDIISLCKNYQIALEKYFYFYSLVDKLSEDVEDGLVVDEAESTSNIKRMMLSYQYCKKFKNQIGSNEPILDPSNTFNINGVTFSLYECSDSYNFETASTSIIRSFSFSENFEEYEKGVFARYVSLFML